jgi:hypothetical protein
MITDVKCEKADMIQVNYEAPVVLLDDIRTSNVGCEYGQYSQR